jgi:hypothetical protein
LTSLAARRFEESNRLCCGKTNPELEQEVAMPLLAADAVTVLPEQREALEHRAAVLTGCRAWRSLVCAGLR